MALTYKENVDDTRESPTLQMFEAMNTHLAPSLKCYDPMVKRDIVPNQYHDLDAFLNDVDLVILMVSHKEILDQMGQTHRQACFRYEKHLFLGRDL